MMNHRPAWLYDEMRQVGRDFTNPAEVAVYDERHAKFRDFAKENEEIVAALGIEAGQTVLDMGAGTGAFSLHAARRGARVCAVDVSLPMLDHAWTKARAKGLTNIRFCHGGFLSYEHRGEPFDAVVSTAALHHLPDFWKSIGLRRVAAMMKPGARFFLRDVVFSFETRDYAEALGRALRAAAESADEQLADDLAGHIREEYSTMSWIVEELLCRAGFAIERAELPNPTWATYLCVKKV